MQLYYKLCNIKNLEKLINISRTTYNDAFRENNTEKNMKEYLESAFSKSKMIKELKEKNTEFYFAYLNNIIVGYFKINSDQAQTDINDKLSIELERFYILKEFQRKKLGDQMIKKVISIAEKKEKEYIWLGVWEKNDKAISFYREYGFVKFGEHPYILGQDVQTDYLMKLNV